MKVIILAGGKGTRLSEITSVRPKPMVEIGDKPILWHIMKIYSHFGFNEFIVCLGYKGYLIKEYFINYYFHHSDLTVDLKENNVEIHNSTSEPWKITMVDTGSETMTGGRLKRISDYLKEEDSFFLTYGDGLSDIDIRKELIFHKEHNKMVTVGAVQPIGRFGLLEMGDGGDINSFLEKPKGEGGWINGGFFICKREVLDYLEDDMTIWEREPLERIAREGEMVGFKHNGFWMPMDTLRDRNQLETLWKKGAPWKVWN